METQYRLLKESDRDKTVYWAQKKVKFLFFWEMWITMRGGLRWNERAAWEIVARDKIKRTKTYISENEKAPN